MKSIVSYPERGKGGKSSYRGNCSPLLIRDLFNYYQPKKVFDPMVGSGTTKDVCEELGINYDVADLNPKWGGWDALKDEIPGVYDMIFFHPPYSSIIKYSGNMWGKVDNRDLSRIPLNEYPRFIKNLNTIQARLFAALRKGGRIAILVGDVKKNGVLYSIQRDMAWLGIPEQVIIKAQHNCMSDKQSYSGKFVPIIHEYLIILKKNECYILPTKITVDKSLAWTQIKTLSWRSAIRMALDKLGGKAKLQDIYKELSDFVISKKHSDPKAKIREVLQTKPEFHSISRGIWALA